MPKAQPPMPSGESKFDLRAIIRATETTLRNGLRIRLLPNPAVPSVSYHTFFRVGSRNERPGLTGISHLFEHMMFNGAKRYGPGEFDQVLESAGGHSNAYTTNDLTVYTDEAASEALEQVIDLESDRMRSLSINDRMLESERQVVLEERRLRVDNEILGRLDEELATLVWKAHPYRWPVIGWQGDIERISRKDCMDYFRTYYAPNNATVYVAGDFEPKQALEWIRKYYGSIPEGQPPPEVVDSEPQQKGERRAQVRHPAQAPSLMVAFRGPPAIDEETLVLDVIQYALSVGQSSRLVRELVYRKQLAVSAAVDWSWRIDPGAFVIVLELRPGVEPAEAERALFEELERVGREGLSSEELQKAKNNLEAHLWRELATNSGRAGALGTAEQLLGNWRRGLTLPGRYETITAEQVRAVAQKTLHPDRRSVAVLFPEAC